MPISPSNHLLNPLPQTQHTSSSPLHSIEYQHIHPIFPALPHTCPPRPLTLLTKATASSPSTRRLCLVTLSQLLSNYLATAIQPAGTHALAHGCSGARRRSEADVVVLGNVVGVLQGCSERLAWRGLPAGWERGWEGLLVGMCFSKIVGIISGMGARFRNSFVEGDQLGAWRRLKKGIGHWYSFVRSCAAHVSSRSGRERMFTGRTR